MLRSGDAVSPIAKAKKTTGASVKLFKETPLALNGYKVWKGQQTPPVPVIGYAQTGPHEAVSLRVLRLLNVVNK